MRIQSKPTEQFRHAMEVAGLMPPDEIYDDGVLHRFSTNGKAKDNAGWYVLHGDGIPAGAFGCWRTGFSQQWSSKSTSTMTQAEREAHRLRIVAMKKMRDEEIAQRQQQVAIKAAARWEAAVPALVHPYLAAKGVKAHGVRTEGESLLIPMRDVFGTLHSLQVIHSDGVKRFQDGGLVKGCYHAIGRPDGMLIVCEGYATGASIHEATGYAVAVAFSSGNLKLVAEALHRKFGELELILAADDDWRTDGNPGLTKATEAARAVGGLVAVPEFPEIRADRDKDFNDLYRLNGAVALKACIDAAKGSPKLTSPKVDFCDPGKFDELLSWPAPTPLPDSLPSVQSFDFELLPEALHGWVADIAHRMQCPPDFTAVGALVALSSLIGARAVVSPKARDDWRVVPNLWGLIVGRPGVMKSPALSEVMKPLTRLEASERDHWREVHKDWEIEKKVATLASDAKEKQAKGLVIKDPAKARELLKTVDTRDEPQVRRYLVNDATVEKLADLLTVNQWGLLVYRDELHGLLCSMDRQGQEGARGFYLTGYDGNQGHAVDRIGRGESYIPRVCLAMLGGIQPGKLQSYVRDAVAGGAGDDGLLQRFGLAVWPDVNPEFKYVDQRPDTQAKQAAWAVFERLNHLQPAADAEAMEWRFSSESQAVFEEWLIPFETEIRGDELHPALVSHLSKYRKLIPALALIFALVDTPENSGVIDKRELIRALAWGDYLRSHAARIYSAAVTPETAGAKKLLEKIKEGKLCEADGVRLDAFTPRQVAVKGWTGLNEPDEVRKAADLLAVYGWLVREVSPAGPKGGRPSDHYLLHPKLASRSSA